MTVQLEELLKAFELNNPYLKFYLNKNDGHMALVTEIPGDDKAENEVTANPDAYIKLPTQADLDLPEMISALMQAAGPGMGVTVIPASWHIRTSSSPGSEIPGVPASVISVTLLPASICSTR